MNIKSILENPEITQAAFEYIYSKWGNEKTYNAFKDSGSSLYFVGKAYQ